MKNARKAIALILALAAIMCMPVAASAAPVDEATIDTTRTGSVDIYKYDLTNAEKDGIWDSSYVSTGVKDADGVESILGSSERVSALNENGEAYGYAIKGVEFTYLKIADIRTYSEAEDNAEHIEVLYGFDSGDDVFLNAIGVSEDDRYAPADADGMYYFRSDVLIDGLKAALDANATTVKNTLENYIKDNGGTAMPLTDEYGHSAADDLPLGLYLFVETKVPEMVTDTTAPFLVSLPMTSVNGTNASDGGVRWMYDVTLYPKNLTGIPTLEKTVREDKADTGQNNGSASITDGYAHTATASDSDVVDYQIISTLPSITSEASYLTDYSFIDTLSKGIAYVKNDAVIEFFSDAACSSKIASWNENSGMFSVSYSAAENGDSVMSITITEDGLAEINASRTVYTDDSMVNSGYSDCTLRVTYSAKLNHDKSVVYGDSGNPNTVVLTWKRTSSEYYDTLVDDCHVYTYGIDLTKQFSDGKGSFDKVEFLMHNDTDIVTDPKGELVRTATPLLLQNGYVVKVFDLIEPSHSDSYNPFRYIHKDSDVFKLIKNFIQNTTPKDSHSSDPFWESAETALEAALMLYLLHEAPPEEQTFEMILTMIEYGGAKEDSDDYQSALDLLFEALEEEQSDHIAVRQYHIFKQAAGKTAKSILVSAAVRLASFTLPEIQNITNEDSLELSMMGDRKQAIFCVIPDSNDTSLNFLVGLLYTQAFQELYYQADKVHMGGLPVPVRLMFDEFANVALPDGYARLQATMRSRNIMATIILQNISQLKALFKDDWEGIIGNADTFIYLGGNEQSTHKYVSEFLGKETIHTKSSSQSKGHNGSFSESTQLTGRELMTPDEVRLLDNKNAIVLIRGERPVVDLKYDLMKHPNVRFTEDGGAAPYVHSPYCMYDMRHLLSEMEELNENQ